MALSDLLSALRAQAAERRAEELERGREEAARLRAEAEVGLERRRRDFVERTREEEEAVSRRVVARAQSEAAGAVLAARDRLLGRVRAALERRIAGATDDPGFRDTLAEELRSALGRLPAGPVVVRSRAELASLLREGLGGRKEVTLEAVPGLAAGFTALAPEVGVEIDATLETRLEYAWPRLAVTVLGEVES